MNNDFGVLFLIFLIVLAATLMIAVVVKNINTRDICWNIGYTNSVHNGCVMECGSTSITVNWDKILQFDPETICEGTRLAE